MANTFRGRAQVAGVSGTFSAPAAFYPLKESMKFSHAFEEVIIKDQQGNDASWRAFNEKFEGDIGMRLVIISPGSNTAAAAAALAAQLTPYQVVTITGCDISAWNTSYQVVSGSDIGTTNTTAGSMSWKLRRYVDATQNTLAATVPT